MLRITSTIGHFAAVSCLIVSMFAFVPCGCEGLDNIETTVTSVVIEAEEGKLIASRRSVRKRAKRVLGWISVCSSHVHAERMPCRFFSGKSERDSINGSGGYLRI
jgi:hypothetical protein